MNTYIGKHGYTITKSDIDDSQTKIIKTQLNVKPYQACKIGGPVPSYPIYRESTTNFIFLVISGWIRLVNAKISSYPKGVSVNIPFKR